MFLLWCLLKRFLNVGLSETVEACRQGIEPVGCKKLLTAVQVDQLNIIFGV